LRHLGAPGRETDPEAQKFMKRLSRGDRFWDSQRLSWVELSGPLLDPVTGKKLSDYVPAALTGTPRIVTRHLFTSSSVDTATWGALLILGLLLLNVYAVAVLMAVVMIFSLSRAVNRLSRATDAVRSGDFSVRIPVRRKDQLGDLQRSFNQMAGDLESLVAASTQKELLEKELALARDLQKSLLPSDLPTDGVQIATLFEPSAAIGGDYFDILRLPDGTLAVFIADVSGHGLSAGLRMAMLKAALTVLVAETRDPEEILRRLDGIVRSTGERRSFVTATLALLNLASGRLDIINAGHPPTYLLRGGEVREILLPGSALGGLGKTYGRITLTLEPGDFLVWLSDGLIEETNAAAESFGYDRVADTLSGAAEHVEELRDRLVQAVDRHADGQPPSDDRTLLVLGYGQDAKQERLATA
jgi:serine phosphatase RsbU (regulator of sigma subunit)